MSRVTLDEIAEACNVSKATVSMALRGMGNISPQRVKAIRETAAKMKYRPSLAAQMLRSKQLDYIGIIMPHSANTVAGSGFSTPILMHFIEMCERQGQKYHVEFFSMSPGDIFIPPSQLTGGIVGGSLIAGYGSDEFQRWLHESCSIPWVSIDEPGEYCVIFEMYDAMRGLIKQLHEMGHRRISFLYGPTCYTSHRMGKEAYFDTMPELGLSTDYKFSSKIAVEDMPYNDMIEWIKAMLSDPDRPSAVICMGIFEPRLICQIAAEMGIKVPHDISVIGFGPPGAGSRSYPQLSCLEPNYNVIVEQSLRMLRNRLNGRLNASDKWGVEVNFVDRQTLAQCNVL